MSWDGRSSASWWTVANDLPYYRDNITKKIAAIHTPVDSPFGRAQQEVERLGEELGIANSTAAVPAATSDSKAETTRMQRSPWARLPSTPFRCAKWSGPPAGCTSSEACWSH